MAVRRDPLVHWRYADLADGYRSIPRRRLIEALAADLPNGGSRRPTMAADAPLAIAAALEASRRGRSEEALNCAMTALLVAALDGDSAACLVFRRLAARSRTRSTNPVAERREARNER
jgi:hypothetical protein